MWQDWIMALGAWVFIVALIPAVKAKDKPPTSTSLMTGGVLTIYVVCMLTLGLVVSAISTGGTAFLWWILFFQKRRQNG